MSLLQSKYNMPFVYKESYFLYNTETNAFLKLNAELYSIFTSKNVNFENDIFESEILKYFRKYKILVDESEIDDYYYQQKFKFYMECYSQNIVSLTILPTTSCNCACPYCFEKDKQHDFMSDAIIEDLISFIHQHINAKTLDLCWYGGEPLLGFNVIKKILGKLENNTSLELRNHQIITNGYLITDDVIAFFDKHPLTEIQITLDGKKETHDKRRVLKGSNLGTYDVILNNIKKVAEAWNNTHVSVRVNIDKDNKEDFVYIRKLINQWNYKNIFVYPGFIRSNDNGCMGGDCRDLNHKDIQDFLFSLGDSDIDVSFLGGTPVTRGCTMTGLNCYLVGPKGEIYKCWNEIGNSSKIIGYINDDKITNISLLSKYMTASNLFDDERCKDCNLFPICSGGCPRRRISNRFFNGEHELCSLYKDNGALLKALGRYYESLTNNKKMDQPLMFK